jgi:hypothetical protein
MNRWLTATTSQEVIMAIRAARRNFGRPNFTSLAKAAFVLFGLAVVGYLAVASGGNSRLLSGGTSGPAAASQTSNTNASTRTTDVQTGGVATTTVPQGAQRDVDYFPNGYVNQATKIEDPIATF